MGFLAPIMVAGIVAVAVPIAIHLIGRRRARTVRFAALDFLLATKRRTARRLRLRERLLLLCRAIACAAVALALAKPYASCERRGPEVARGPQAAVLVIDDSFAAGVIVDGRPWLKAAGDEARRILTQLGPEAEVAIVHTAEGAEHPTELTRDHIKLRDQLLALEPTARPADTTRALAAAAQLLASSSHTRKTVYLLSLLAKSGLRDEPAWGSGGPALVVDDLRPSALANLAVTSLRAESQPGAGTRALAFDAEVGNFSPAGAVAAGAPAGGAGSATGSAGATTVELSLSVGDRVVAKGRLDVPAGERRTKRFLATLPAGVRAADASVSLTGDALAIDDRRWLRATLRDEVRVLLVDGDPRTVRRDDELFYLEAALRPGDRDDSGAAVRVITPDDLAGVLGHAQAATLDLAEFDVVVLANVPALPVDQVAALAAWVDAGGGLFIAPGDRVDESAYDHTMLPLLPQPLADPIDTTWGAGADERASRALHLVKWDVDHPIFAPFQKAAPGLADAKFYKLFLLDPSGAAGAGGRDRKVLAQLTNGAAALVEGTRGGGRVLLYTSTFDRDWNDLPIHAGYLPLMQQAVRYLARKHAPTGEGDHLVGSTVALPTGDLARLEIRGPDGIVAVFEGERLDGRSSVRFTRTDRPGAYRVIGTDRAGATRERDELDFVVNVDPRGSELAAAPASMLPASGTGAGGEPADESRRIELWHALAAVLLVVLVVEGLLVQR
jgi:hypothetical protein